MLAGGAARVEELEPLELKGKAEPVAAFRLLAVGEPPERSHRSLFVGRSGELELLRDAWGRVVEGGRCELVTVVGEPGVGKSRLAAELIAGLDATRRDGPLPLLRGGDRLLAGGGGDQAARRAARGRVCGGRARHADG